MKVSNTMINFSSVCVSVCPSTCSYSGVYSSPSLCLCIIRHSSFYVLFSINMFVTRCKCPGSLSFQLPCESARLDCVIMQTFVLLLAINTTISLQIHILLGFLFFHIVSLDLALITAHRSFSSSSLTSLLSPLSFPLPIYMSSGLFTNPNIPHIQCHTHTHTTIRTCTQNHTCTHIYGPVFSLKAHDADLAHIALNADGSRLATASEKGTLIRLWDCHTGMHTDW